MTATISTVCFCFLASFLAAVDGRNLCALCGSCAPQAGLESQCHCDEDCETFGACCFSSSPPGTCPPSQLQPLQPGVELECRFIYLNLTVEDIGQIVGDSFLMVTSCPDSWPDEDLGSSTVRANCVLDDAPLPPPVTDMTTGIVYKNKFCAICNGVERLQVWERQLFCTDYGYGILNDTTLSMLEDIPDFFSTYCQTCFFSAPNLRSIPPPRTCAVVIQSCLNKSSLEARVMRNILDSLYSQIVRECEFGPIEAVGVPESKLIFRNRACALCNGEGRSECLAATREGELEIPKECIPANSSDTGLEGGSSVPDFTITLSNLGTGRVRIRVDTEQLIVVVDCPPGQAPVGLECRSTQCPAGYSITDRGCVLQVDPPLPDGDRNCSLRHLDPHEFTDLGNDTVLFEGEQVTLIDHDDQGRPLVCINTTSSPSNDSSPVLDCPTALLPLNDTDFEDRGNGTIFFDGETVEVLFYDSLGRPLVCPDNTSLVEVNTTIITLLPGIAELAYIGCSLSILGSGFLLVTYTLFSELRTLPSLLLMNLSLAVLITNLFFIIGVPVMQHVPSVGFCTTVAICLHLFCLAQCSWMTLFSIEVARKFYFAKMLVSAGRSKCFSLPVYMLLGWGVPLGTVIVAMGINFSVNDLVLYGVTSDGRVGNCWINHLASYVVFFFVPLVLSVVINLVMLVVVSVFLWQSSRTNSDIQQSNRYTLFRVWVAVLSTTGLTWVFGFLAIIEGSRWAWYFFVIFNSTQGFTIFLAFLLAKKVFGLYANLCIRKMSTRIAGVSKPSPSTSDCNSMELRGAAQKCLGVPSDPPDVQFSNRPAIQETIEGENDSIVDANTVP